MRVRNISPDVLSVPLLGRIVQPGEVVDVPDEQEGWPEEQKDGSHLLLWAPDTWEVVTDKPAKAKAVKPESAGE